MKESELQGEIGVSRDKLRWIRRGLEAGVHFVKEGRNVVYTALGIEAVRGKIGEELGAAIGNGTDGTDRSNGPVVADLVVVRTVRNPKIVMCERILEAEPGGDTNSTNGHEGVPENRKPEVVRVLVQSNKNFLPGMRLRARWAHDDVWTLEGRCPRWRGKW